MDTGATISGVVGQIKWAYYNAAAVNGYTVGRVKTRAGITWTLVATVVMVDKFKMSQRPLYFVAPHARGAWRWPIVDFDLTGGRLVADLGPPLERESSGVTIR